MKTRTYFVAYKIDGPEEGASGLVTQLANFFDAHWQVMPDVWIIQCRLKADGVFRMLKPHLYGEKDSLIIGEISNNSVFTGFSPEISEFLRDVL